MWLCHQQVTTSDPLIFSDALLKVL
jgi:hypothetical protein